MSKISQSQTTKISQSQEDSGIYVRTTQTQIEVSQSQTQAISSIPRNFSQEKGSNTKQLNFQTPQRRRQSCR